MQSTGKRWQVVRIGTHNGKVRLIGTPWKELSGQERREAIAALRSEGIDGERTLLFLMTSAA